MPSKKPTKKKKKDPYVTRKRLDTEGFDFVALVAGMVTTLLFTLLILGNLFSRNSAARAIEMAADGDTGKVLAELDSDTFEQVLRSSDSEKLVEYIEGLNENTSTGDPIEDFRMQLRRIDIANAMLVLPLGESQRQLAVMSKLDGMFSAYLTDLRSRLGQPNLAGNLLNFANEYSDDAKVNVSRKARLALFKLEAFELTKTVGTPSTKPVVKHVEKLLKRFPDDEIVHQEIRGIVDYYLSEYDKNTGVDFVKRIQLEREKFDKMGALNFIDGLSDYIVLEQADYQRLFDNRLVQGPAGQKQLFKTSLDLLNEPNAGKSLIAKVDEVAHWFEQVDQEKATKIYKELASKTVSYEIAGVAPFAQQTSEAGLKRADAIGKPIRLEGVLLDGGRLKPEVVEGKVVVVLFWSKDNPAAINALKKFHLATLAWPESEVAILSVCVDERPGEVMEIANQTQRFNLLIQDPVSKQNLIYQQCPSLITPRAMIVGRDGKVKYINVPIEELKNSAQLMIAESE